MSHFPPVVLIVDDHRDSADMYAFSLGATGFAPITAETAEEAFARACEMRPDIVVADVTLAGRSGLELTRWLREDVRTRSAGIIVLSGHSTDAVQQQAADAGCDRFVLKPCMPEVLAAAVRGLIEARTKTASVAQS